MRTYTQTFLVFSKHRLYVSNPTQHVLFRLFSCCAQTMNLCRNLSFALCQRRQMCSTRFDFSCVCKTLDILAYKNMSCAVMEMVYTDGRTLFMFVRQMLKLTHYDANCSHMLLMVCWKGQSTPAEPALMKATMRWGPGTDPRGQWRRRTVNLKSTGTDLLHGTNMALKPK